MPKIFTLGTRGVERALGFAFVALARVLYHRYERLSLLRVDGLAEKVGIDHNRLAERILSVTFLVIAVSQLKRLAKGAYDLAKLALIMKFGIRSLEFGIVRCEPKGHLLIVHYSFFLSAFMLSLLENTVFKAFIFSSAFLLPLTKKPQSKSFFRLC